MNTIKLLKVFAILLSLAVCALCDCDAPVLEDVDRTVTKITELSTYPQRDVPFLQELYPYTQKTKTENGVQSVELLKSPSNPGLYRLVEKFENQAALDAHLAGEVYTEVFNTEYYQNLRLIEETSINDWETVQDVATDPVELLFQWDMDCSVQHVWDVISNWEDASWGEGHPTTELSEDGKVQTRTWANGHQVRVKLNLKDEENYYMEQETLGGLTFDSFDVKFDTFIVHISLVNDNTEGVTGVDPESQSRIHYHAIFKANPESASVTSAVKALKLDFARRSKYYGIAFNCSNTRQQVVAKKNVQASIKALEAGDKDAYLSYFSGEAVDAASSFFDSLKGEVAVFTPVKISSTPDLQVIAVEDVFVSGLFGAKLVERVTVYQANEFGSIVSYRTFDENPGDDKTKISAEELVVLETKIGDYTKAESFSRVILARKGFAVTPIQLDMHYDLDAFWAIISDWNNIDWVQYTTAVDFPLEGEPGVRRIHFGKDFAMEEKIVYLEENENDKYLTYMLTKGSLSSKIYQGWIHLHREGKDHTTGTYTPHVYLKDGKDPEVEAANIIKNFEGRLKWLGEKYDSRK